MMPSVIKLRERLLKKLKELFQLDQPDLDFGFYRIMHAKSQQVSEFIEKDLFKIIEDAFGQRDDAHTAAAKATYENAIKTAKEFGAPDPENAPAVKEAKAKFEAIKDTASSEEDIYDHLYRFFERYYDAGDFISRRYYVRETSGRAAPFAIPYNGEEVKLHWANADQYYIKTAEHFTTFTFDLQKAKEVSELGEGIFQSQTTNHRPLKVHFQIVDATEGEHGNIKADNDQKRYFMIYNANPVKINAKGEIIVNFEYRPDPEKTGQEGTWRDRRNAESVELVFSTLSKMAVNNGSIQEYLNLLNVSAPTESDKNRPLLARYINQYTARNTMDYFIHKDLGKFLHRELDYYVKNEVMWLDDIENAEAPFVESYLAKIKVLRKIAGKLIDLLAQMEDFQKKLWLKKKFVFDVNYCITLDQVPEELYPKIVTNEAQHNEWIKLFSIDKIEENLINPGYTLPLTTEFLKANNNLVLDTCFFSEDFKAKLISYFKDFDAQCDGVLIHSENFQALSAILSYNRGAVKCIYIDPPYNTGQDDFIYKDNYQGSSWLSMISDRLTIAKSMLRRDGAIAISIDENELSSLLKVMDDIFNKENRVGIATVKRGSVTGHKAINKGIVNITEYLVIYALDKSSWSPGRAFAARERNERYNKFIINREKSHEKWELKTLLEVFAKYKGIPKSQLKGRLGEAYEQELFEFVKANARSVIRLADPDESNVSKDAKEAIKLSKKNKKEIMHFERNGVPDMYLLGGQRLLFYSDKLIEIDGDLVTAEPLSDLWDDVLPNDLHNEGGVSLKKGKKPEKLLNRVYEICTDANDLTMDFFLGSGTSAATALKKGLKFIGIEHSDYFDTKAVVRLKIINETKKKHELERSFLFKYIRLESYEDTLNNLHFDDNPARKKLIAVNDTLREDYMLHYLLDVETRGSKSLLNINAFSDPREYTLRVKKPGSDEYSLRRVDLLETFNYLIGLRVVSIAEPREFSATFKRVEDKDIPVDQETKLVLDGKIKKATHGDKLWWFRKVEGWVPKDPLSISNSQHDKVLIIWRTLTDDLEKDNLMLNEWFQEIRSSSNMPEYEIIYVNGSNNLPNIALKEDRWKVRLIEEEFMKRMWHLDNG
jgi:adenine-specific DNA-methyltransferase